MPSNYYRLAIEALGMRSRKSTVINRLNHVAAHAEDAKLQELCSQVIRELEAATTDPTVVAVGNMQSIKTPNELKSYCDQKIAQAAQ